MFKLRHITLLTISSLTLTACQEHEDFTYYPLAKKLRWYYQTSMIYKRRSIESKLIIENLGKESYDGQTVFTKRNHAGQNTFFFQTKDAILRNTEEPSLDNIDSSNENHFILPTNIKTGDAWQLVSRPYVMEHALEYEVALQTSTPGLKLSKPLQMDFQIESVNETVEVPAGRFSNCIKIVGAGTCYMSASGGNFSGSVEINVDHKDWYCPGVGLTRTERTETDPSKMIEAVTYLLELEEIVEPSNFW